MHPRVRFAPMRRTILLVSLFLLATMSTSIAQARRRPPPPPPQQPQPTFQWDSRGWTMLGEQTVSGRVDRDAINVGRYEGRVYSFDRAACKLTFQENPDRYLDAGGGVLPEPR